MRRADKPYHLHVATVLKSGSFNLLEHSGPAEACNGIALSLPYKNTYAIFKVKYSYSSKIILVTNSTRSRCLQIVNISILQSIIHILLL